MTESGAPTKEAQEVTPHQKEWPVYPLASRPRWARRRQRTIRKRVQGKGVKPSPRPKRGAEARQPVQRTWRAA